MFLLFLPVHRRRQVFHAVVRDDDHDVLSLILRSAAHLHREAHQMLDVPLDGPRDGSYLPRYLRAKKVKELAKVYGLWGKTDSDFQRASK